jgi:hypothetical protein
LKFSHLPFLCIVFLNLSRRVRPSTDVINLITSACVVLILCLMPRLHSHTITYAQLPSCKTSTPTLSFKVLYKMSFICWNLWIKLFTSSHFHHELYQRKICLHFLFPPPRLFHVSFI